MKKVLYLYDKSKCTLRCTYIQFNSDNQISDYTSVTFSNVVLIHDHSYDVDSIVAVDKITKEWRKVLISEFPLIIV